MDCLETIQKLSIGLIYPYPHMTPLNCPVCKAFKGAHWAMIWGSEFFLLLHFITLIDPSWSKLTH